MLILHHFLELFVIKWLSRKGMSRVWSLGRRLRTASLSLSPPPTRALLALHREVVRECILARGRLTEDDIREEDRGGDALGLVAHRERR